MEPVHASMISLLSLRMRLQWKCSKNQLFTNSCSIAEKYYRLSLCRHKTAKCNSSQNGGINGCVRRIALRGRLSPAVISSFYNLSVVQDDKAKSWKILRDEIYWLGWTNRGSVLLLLSCAALSSQQNTVCCPA